MSQDVPTPPPSESDVIDDPWGSDLSDPPSDSSASDPPASGVPPTRRPSRRPAQSRPPAPPSEPVTFPGSTAAAAFVVSLVREWRPRLQSWIAEVQPQIQPHWERVQKGIRPWWYRLLAGIRTRIPESWNAKLSNRVLSSLVIGIFLVLLWSSLGLLPGKHAPSVASTPVPSPVPTPVVSPSPLPPAPPILDRAPEQRLIAQIQDQVAEVTNRYSEGLIQAVQANFRNSLLTVRVGDAWYSLAPSRQDSLADEMLGRSQSLDFKKLEILSNDGKLLARSPVVGSAMVILKRTL